MGLSKKKALVVVGAVAATLAVTASSVTYFTSAYSSMTMAMLEIMEDEQPEKEQPDSIIEEVSAEVDSTEYIIGVNCYDEWHKMILETDIDKLPDDANYIDTKTTPMIMMYADKDTGNRLDTAKPFPLKSYLRLYALAAEICLREEINPKDSDVKINPMDLIGESFCESPLQNCGEDLKDTALIWLSEKYLTTNKAGTVAPEALKLQAGTSDWGSPYAEKDNIAKTYRLSNCPSFFGQAMFYSYCWDSNWGDYAACIYISEEENPTLDSNKRAVFGSREEIYKGSGRYVTGEFWNGDTSLELASYDELKSSIKEGIFERGSEFGYLTRPASYYLSDSMYTHAIQIRSFLKNRAKGSRDLRSYDEDGPWSVTNLERACGALNDKQKDYLETVKKMYVLTRFTGDGWYDVSEPPIYSSDPSNLGDLTKVYLEFVQREINPFVTELPLSTDVTEDREFKQKLLGKPNSICDVFVHGDSNSLDPNRKYQLKLNNKVATTDADIKPGRWGNHTMYGFDCLNAGNVAFPAFQQQIQGAYKAAPKPKAEKKPTQKVQETTKLCWPLNSTYNKINKNGYFGLRSDSHMGVDITAKTGADVYAIASGTVVDVGTYTVDVTNSDRNVSTSAYIIIEHGKTNDGFAFYSTYGNISRDSKIEVGAKVSQRQKIGIVEEYNPEFGDGIQEIAANASQGITSLENIKNLNPRYINTDNSYLHFAVAIYKEDKKAEYTYQYSDDTYDLAGNHPELFYTYFNPVALDWYDGRSDSAKKISIKTHDDEPLVELYDGLGYEQNNEHLKWSTSFNYLNDDDNPKISEALSNNLSVFSDNAGIALGGGSYDKYSEWITEILTKMMGSESSVGDISGIVKGATSIDLKLSCVPFLSSELFVAEKISQGFGCPWEGYLFYDKGGHAGIDFRPGTDNRLFAAAHGKIKDVEDTISGFVEGSLGNHVWIELDNGWVLTYNHMSYVAVKEKQEVQPGDYIGDMGNTGHSYGTHLHLELLIPVKEYNSMVKDMKLLDKTPARGALVHYIDSAPGYKRADPWLLYCLDPNYDFLHTACSGCSTGIGSHQSDTKTYTWITNTPFKGHLVASYNGIPVDLTNSIFITYRAALNAIKEGV